MDRIPIAIGLSLFGCLSYFGLYGAESLRIRIDEMEHAALTEVRENSLLKRELAQLETEFAAVEAELESRNARLASAEGVTDLLDSTNHRIEDLGRAIAAHTIRIESVAQHQESFDPATIESSLKEMDRTMAERWKAVYGIASSAAELAGASQRKLEQLGSEVQGPGFRQEMWDTLLGPVVQLSGEESVGSGVIIRGRTSGDSDELVDYVLTAWHVVRDIQGSLYNRDMPVPVTIYLAENETQKETAELLEFDPIIDLALLRLNATAPCKNTARLTNSEQLDELRIFDSIYAVGCPLGNDPIPTLGQVSALDHNVDGESYLMINAPTYVGNSGGGIFTAESRELLGIFSKVYTHGSLRPTIVTHMGLVTPMTVVYEWFGEVDYGFLVPSVGRINSGSVAREAAAQD